MRHNTIAAPNFTNLISYLSNMYIYFSNFIAVFFNKYYYIYIKSFISSNVTHWTLFSYTVDKYYISINKLLKYQKSHFLKYLELIYLDPQTYVDNLIKFKRNNSAFKTEEDYQKYLITQFYQYTPSQIITFINTDMPDSLFLDDEDDEETDNYIHPNPFEFKLKHLISSNRKCLINLLNYKFKRQYRITRFIANFIKFRVDRSFTQSNFTLSATLLVSKLVLNIKYMFGFINQGLVYVNGKAVFKPDFKLAVGDKIQLIVTPSFYDYYFYQFNSFLKVTLKYHNKFFKGEEPNFKSVLKKPNNSLLILLSSFKQGIPRYLEVDFLTLSMVVVYTPTNYIFVNNYMHFIYNFYLNRLYN